MGELIKSGNLLVWTNDGERLMIEPWGENSLRVRSRMMGEILDTDFALDLQISEINAAIEINEDTGTLTNGKIKAVINNGIIAFYNQDDKLLLEEIGAYGSLKLAARAFKPIIGGDFHLTASFESNPLEKLYGMGQYQQEIMDIKGCNFELAHRNSQASIPFVISDSGYGFLWHNPAIGRASFGKNRTEWYSESAKQLDYWITAGDTPAEIIESYMTATGKPPMMPEYGLGFWQCKLRYYSQEQILNVAREYKRRNLPIDVIVCDFFHWPKCGDFRFDEKFFPDPKAMVSELKEMNIELMVSIWPLIDLDSENYKEMKSKNLLVKHEKGIDISMKIGSFGLGAFYDVTNPDARKYVWDKCKKNYYDYGIKSFWLDEAEPEYQIYDFDNYRYFMGPNAQIGNIYPKLYLKGFYEGLKEEGHENSVGLVRCAWAGSQKYGALVWSGDVHSTYADFRRQVCAGLQMGISGIPWWTTDIGGFIGGDPTDEGFRKLLVRWFQYGAFCPIMRLHGDRKPYTYIYDDEGTRHLGTGADNEVWSYGEANYEIFVKYMELRERMRPYTRELMKQAHEKGSPVMRTMFYEFPDDIACWDAEFQYMYGSDILAAPIVYEDAYERAVYLPKGAKWTNMHTKEQYEGGQTIMVSAPIEIMPIFLKDGFSL